MKELTCIICPRGCHLQIDDSLNVTGNFCPRGAKYAKEEITCPKRIITTFIRVNNRENTVVSVKTSDSIEKALMFKVLEEINKVKVSAPVKVGDVVIKNVLGTGADVVITKEIL